MIAHTIFFLRVFFFILLFFFSWTIEEWKITAQRSKMMNKWQEERGGRHLHHIPDSKSVLPLDWVLFWIKHCNGIGEWLGFKDFIWVEIVQGTLVRISRRSKVPVDVSIFFFKWPQLILNRQELRVCFACQSANIKAYIHIHSNKWILKLLPATRSDFSWQRSILFQPIYSHICLAKPNPGPEYVEFRCENRDTGQTIRNNNNNTYNNRQQWRTKRTKCTKQS